MREKAEQGRIAAEVREKAEQDRIAAEVREKAEQDRIAAEAREKAEQGRITAEANKKEVDVAAALAKGCKPYNQARLMLVGEGRAGKTAVANSILGKGYQDTHSTVGKICCIYVDVICALTLFSHC